MDRPGHDPNKLLQLASKLRARTAVEQSLELLLS
jgi:hypothetical protein